MRSPVRAARWAGAMLAGAVLVTGSAGPAAAEPVAEAARDKAARASAEANDLRVRLDEAVAAYDAALRDAASATSAALEAANGADVAADGRERARAWRDTRIRALYMGGGLAAYARALTAATPVDLPSRVAYLQGVLAADRRLLDLSSADARRHEARAASAAAAADASRGRAGGVRARRGALDVLLAAATARRDALLSRARRLETAERAAALEAAAGAADLAAIARTSRRAAARAETARSGQAHGRAVPGDYARLYAAAAATCPGLPGSVLTAIGQVESGHGANAVESSAGAQGPMQFMPTTFASYAVDGDRDGDTDIHDPADAVFTAARYLCATGGARPESLPRALWHYNHAQWYVDMVLRIARDLDPALP